MEELSIEEKAKHYDEALERAKGMHEEGMMSERIEYIFPELKESEDEKIKKELISNLKETIENIRSEEIISNDAKVLVGKMQKWIAWLEKQGEQEELYIRFGEIPTDEKSKIYNGEIEVGTENGVSVYHAFKTHEGDIVLGLSLPITKTTLYTQQHLIEYSDRPCYLVKGDYVGKDTDGQPLINNVNIIKKIGTYRVKEEKQGEQKELRKIEQKSAWSEKDERKITELKVFISKCNGFNKANRERAFKLIDSLKSQSHWKPSDEQMEVFEHFVRSVGESGYTSPYDNNTKLLYSLLEQLKKLKEE